MLSLLWLMTGFGMAQDSPRFDQGRGGRANGSTRLILSSDATFPSSEAVNLNVTFSNLSKDRVFWVTQATVIRRVCARASK